MSAHKDLYIYEIEGTIPDPKNVFQEDFLGSWCEGKFSYLFFSKNRNKEVKTYLLKHPSLSFLSETVMDYKDWEAGKDLEPFRVGRFYVCPLWEKGTPADNDILIKIDPRLAFGSGNHVTTKNCLESLCVVYQENTPRRVLDLGCGTGILSVASAKLGADTVLAVDYSTLAVETAQRNCLINGEAQRIGVVEGDALEHLSWEADLLLANIRYPVIEELMKCSHFVQKRWFVISGLLDTEAQQALQKLSELSVTIIKVVSENSWFTIVGKREVEG